MVFDHVLHAGSSMFPDFLHANGIGSAITPGGAPYCVMGGLWKQKRQIEKEFQGWKAVELENAAETEQQHADHIRKLVRCYLLLMSQAAKHTLL